VKATLNYGEGVHWSRILGEWSKYDWLRNGFFTGQGLQYGQDFSNEELQASMKT
jgi:hypothetical protein